MADLFNYKLLELSEDVKDKSKTALRCKFLICVLDEGNENGVGIKESDITEEEVKGLIGEPVVTKLKKNMFGENDLSGHNKRTVSVTGKDGKKFKKVVFDTYAVGYHTSAQIEEIEINKKLKKCITAECLIWRRYDETVEVIERLYNDGELRSSFELLYQDTYIENGIKWRTGITFIGNCLLGKYVNPAYKDAGALEVAEECEDEIASALERDINKLIENQGGNKMADKAKENVEVSALTDNDLYSKVSKAVSLINKKSYVYISRLYPYDYKAIVRSCDAENEDDYIEVTFTINSDDTVSITGQKDVKMSFIEVSTVEDLKTELANVKADLDKKNEDIIKLGTDIAEKDKVIEAKDTEIAELVPYKERFEQAEAEKQQEELASKKEALIEMATKTGYITKEEIETSEVLKEAIEKLDESAIKSEIAERVISGVKPVATNEDVETSETEEEKDDKEVKIDISSTDEEENTINYKEVMKIALNR